MDARRLVRATNAALVAGVGMGAGHLLMPARTGTPAGIRALFVACVAGSGALAAWRERSIGAEYRDGPMPGAPWLWLAAGALAALTLAALAWWVVHG